MNPRFFKTKLKECISTARDNKKKITLNTLLATAVLFPAAMAALFVHYLNNKNQADARFDESLNKLNTPTFNTSTFPGWVQDRVILDRVISCRRYVDDRMSYNPYGSPYEYASGFCPVYPRLSRFAEQQYLWELCYEALNTYCNEYSEEHSAIESANIGMAFTAISAIIFLATVIPLLRYLWRKQEVVIENNADHEIELSTLDEANDRETMIDIDPDSIDDEKPSIALMRG